MYSTNSTKAGSYIFVYYKCNLNAFRGGNSYQNVCFNSEKESTLKGKNLHLFGVFDLLGSNPFLFSRKSLLRRGFMRKKVGSEPPNTSPGQLGPIGRILALFESAEGEERP